ncbi:hypothetical protein [Chryseobacterium vrystaatense]|uniref:hypothetical protein n=1 Tax=Chryseobacterium vrystaatense TaxID=307480 RepID=UPI00093262D9|nr:hypothetical protein [Chryseobacterium vrystaatense]
MNSFFLYLLVSVQFLMVPLNLNAQKHHSTDHPGIHGMVLFGEHEQYASHLPLFYSPHDYQIILKVKLDSSAEQAYINDRKTTPTELYTIEPEKFVLPEIMNDIHSFKANLYRGHFERGGQLILQNVTVQIEKVAYFKKLIPTQNQKEPFRYMLFGNKQEQFMVHQILNRPEFDEILSVQVSDVKTKSKLDEGEVLTISLPAETIKPYPWKFNTESKIGTIKMNVLKQIYLEFDDLK